MHRRSLSIYALILAGLGLAACGAAAGSPPAPLAGASPATQSTGADAKVTAVATTSILADLVANVGGDRVAVSALLPAGADPHTFSPSPNEARAVADAQILVENGAGLEEWLSELIDNAGGERTTVVASEGVTPIEGNGHAEAGEPAAASGAAAARDEGHTGEGVDPHMWLDPNNVIVYVENIRDGLKQVDPQGAAVYDANATRYIEQLRVLDAENQQLLAAIPAERRKLVTNHDTFGYFARRYGFEIAGTVFEGVSTEEEPTPRQVARLVERIRETGTPAIFAENTGNLRLVEQIAEEAGVSVVTDLYTDALGEPGSAGDTYLKMLRHDVGQIVAALK